MTSRWVTGRKIASTALACLGVAGLSVAAAAQLQLDPATSIRTGDVTVAADCQSAEVTVTFDEPTIDGDEYTSGSVSLGNLASQCADHRYRVEVSDGAAPAGTYVSTGVVDGDAVSHPLRPLRADAISWVALTLEH